VTALLGRVWCGWACPHTVFLDHVYRVIERWIDGDALSRRTLQSAPLTASTIARRVAKHGLYLVLSTVIAHLFLAYFVSWPRMRGTMRTEPGADWGAFAFVALFTGGLYFNFGWFREQLCLISWPYG